MFDDESSQAAKSGMNVKIILHRHHIPVNYVISKRELLRKLDLAKPITFTYWLTKADTK